MKALSHGYHPCDTEVPSLRHYVQFVTCYYRPFRWSFPLLDWLNWLIKKEITIVQIKYCFSNKKLQGMCKHTVPFIPWLKHFKLKHVKPMLQTKSSLKCIYQIRFIKSIKELSLYTTLQLWKITLQTGTWITLLMQVHLCKILV